MSVSRRRKLEARFEVLDKETKKVLYYADVDFKVSKKEEKSSLFAASLIQMEPELMEKFVTTRWRRRK